MPEQDNTNYFKGIQKGLLKAYKGAIADYRKEIELNPNFEDTFYYLVNSKYPLPCCTAIAAPASNSMKDVLALNKYNMACDKVSSKNYRGAIADYSKAIALDPNFTNAYNNRGFCKRQLKDYKGAIADYSIAIKFRPNTADAYNNRGSSKDEIKDYRGAIADYSKAIALQPNFADAYYSRGNSKLQLKDYIGAIADYSKAIELKPDNADAYYNRGNSKILLKDYNGAITDYSKAIELNIPEKQNINYNGK
jgi:tetratricopeptide (TPR) repeat protein